MLKKTKQVNVFTIVKSITIFYAFNDTYFLNYIQYIHYTVLWRCFTIFSLGPITLVRMQALDFHVTWV